MRFATLTATALAILSVAGPALAQTTITPARFGAAPWWMDQPIIASTGSVYAQLSANRAYINAEFVVVGKSSPDATKAAADSVRALSQQLAAYGVDRVRTETTFSTNPIYSQYRDKSGELIDNERADKIEGYEVKAELSVELHDVALTEEVYARILAARPTSVEEVSFTLEPTNATKTEMFSLAVSDAARRAKLAVDATGTRLGAVKLIDPTGRACQTDVLITGAPRDYITTTGQRVSVSDSALEEVVVVGARATKRKETMVADDLGNFAGMKLTLQPPLQTVSATACVVYSLGG